MKTNHFNYMDLIKKYMLKIVSFCAFLDIIDKKGAFYMENNQKKLKSKFVRVFFSTNPNNFLASFICSKSKDVSVFFDFF